MAKKVVAKKVVVVVGPALLIVVSVLVGLSIARSSGEDRAAVHARAAIDNAYDGGPGAASDSAFGGSFGNVAVRIEGVQGPFIEGFEVALRFETEDGTLVAATLWSDFVRSQGEATMDAYYRRVLNQQVPAGRVSVRAAVSIGGSGQEVPDLSGDLPCRSDVEVASGATVDLEIRFENGDECLVRRGAPPASTTPQSFTTTTLPQVASDLTVGESLYVDVDLHCRSFFLVGLWVYAEGNIETWQRSGERHEGGTLTIVAPGVGRFQGDAAGTKTATFRLVESSEVPPAPSGSDVRRCTPIPR